VALAQAEPLVASNLWAATLFGQQPQKKLRDVENLSFAPTTPRDCNIPILESKGAKHMKYMLMMSGTKAQFDWFTKWSKKDLEAQFAFMHAFNKELAESGVLIAAEGLAFPDQAKIVRAGSDGAPVTDGVFPEAKEFLAGFWIIDVESPEQAYKIAARASAAPGPGGKPGNMPIEVRQVMSGPPEELL
jgi:hypothetical protein